MLSCWLVDFGAIYLEQELTRINACFADHFFANFVKIEQSNCLMEIFFEKIELDQLALSVSQWRPERLKDNGFFFGNDNSLSSG